MFIRFRLKKMNVAYWHNLYVQTLLWKSVNMWIFGTFDKSVNIRTLIRFQQSAALLCTWELYSAVFISSIAFSSLSSCCRHSRFFWYTYAISVVPWYSYYCHSRLLLHNNIFQNEQHSTQKMGTYKRRTKEDFQGGRKGLQEIHFIFRMKHLTIKTTYDVVFHCACETMP